MKYEEYKDSGMSWIGQVPTQWKRSRLKFLFSHSNAGVWGEEEKGDENDIACFRVADFDYQKGYLGFDKLTMRNITAKELEGRLLSQGSLLIEKSGGGDATPVGRVVRFNYEDKATCSNFVHFVTVNESHNSDFLYYYFYAMYANKENLLYFNQTTGIQNLKVGEYLGQSIFIPTYEEQQAIASYLDKKCGKINGAIDVQKKKIDLLNELKQTIITNAVTKGLNPDAPMKNSGVEWTGMIPSNFSVRRLKTLCKSIRNGYVGPTRDLYVETGIPYIQSVHIKEGKIIFEREEYYVSEDWANKHPKINKGNIVVVQTGDIGQIALVDDKYDKCNCHALIILAVDNNTVSSEYLSYYLRSRIGKELMLLTKTGALLPHLNSTQIGDTMVVLPPLKEQQYIVDYIKGEEESFDIKISKANRRIELLNELKQSIITEAVTGKIKVI